MDIYLAGENGKSRFLWEIYRGGKTDMDIYLAGGISGNLRPLWTKIADGGGNMKIYLAGEHPVKNGSLATGGGRRYSKVSTMPETTRLSKN